MIIKRLATSFESLYLGGTQTVHHSGHSRFAALFAPGQPWVWVVVPLLGGLLMPGAHMLSSCCCWRCAAVVLLTLLSRNARAKHVFSGLMRSSLATLESHYLLRTDAYLFERRNSVSSVSILTNPLSC